MNSVIILFITDIDELFFGILDAINSGWVQGECHSGATVQDLEAKIAALREEFEFSRRRGTPEGVATPPQDAGDGGAPSETQRNESPPPRERSDQSRSPQRFRKRNWRLRGKTIDRRNNSFSE